MTKLKNKTVLRMAVFAIIMTMVLWMMPAGIISAEGSSSLEELQAAADLANAAVTEAQIALDGANAELADAQAAGAAEEVILAAQASVDVAVSAFAAAQEAADAANEALAAAQLGETPAPPDPNSGQDGDQSGTNPDLTGATGVSVTGSVVLLSPTLSTDKPDYRPYETVIISGTGFAPDTDYTITVTPLGSEFTPDTFTVTTNPVGGFDYNYTLNVVTSLFHVNATDANGNIVATTSFTDCHIRFIVFKYYGANIPLDGATFKVYYAPGGGTNPASDPSTLAFTDLLDTDITGTAGAGLIYFPNNTGGWFTNYGWYKIIETDAPTGYSIVGSGVQYYCYYNSNQDSGSPQLNFENAPCKGSISVTKTGLLGAGDRVNFMLYKSDFATQLGSITVTKESPTATWNDLPYGDYIVAEDFYSSYPTLYNNIHTYVGPIKIDVTLSGPTATANYPNTAITGTVDLTKTFEGLSPLPIVNFYLKDSTGQYYSATGALVSKAAAARPISANGSIQWTGLPVPRNYLIEEDTVAHYSQTITPSSFTIDANTPRQFVAVTATNIQKANVDLVKTFVGGFVDANFYLTDGIHYFMQDGSEAANKAAAKVTVNSNTTIHWVDLPPGNSYVIEEDPIVDYTPSGLPLSFGVGPGATATINVTNTRHSCDVNIVKLIDGAPAAEGIFGFAGLGSVSKTGAAGPIIGISDFTLPDAGLYNKTFTLYCGLPYTITEDSIPAGYSFSDIATTPGVEIVSQSGSSITFILRCAGGISGNQVNAEVVRAVTHTITFNNTRIPGLLRLQKVDSTNTLQPVANAVYEVRDSGGHLVEIITTAADGWAVVSLPWGTYTVKEVTAPTGYALDPTTYGVTIGATSTTVWLYVKDDPTGGGGGTLTVAGLTEGIQVLAFTGIDPIIPISGGSTVIAGIAMLVATLRRRNKYSGKHTTRKEDEKSTKWWLNLL